MVWPGWTTDCCFMVSGARPRVIGLLEAWGDSVGLQGEHKSVSQKLVSLGPSLQLYGRWTHCSVDSNTVVMNGRVDFPKKRLAHQWPGSALGRPERSKGGSGCCHPSGVLSLSTLPPPPPQDVNFALMLAGSALTRGVGHGVPRELCTSAGAAAGRGAQASWGREAGQPQGSSPALGGAGEGLLTPVVVVGSHERAARRDGCHPSGPARCGDLSKMWAWSPHSGVDSESPGPVSRPASEWF